MFSVAPTETKAIRFECVLYVDTRTYLHIFYYTDLFFNLFGMTNNVNERLAIKFGLIAIYRFASMFRKL